MSDRAFRGKILDTMPAVEHRAGVVLPGDPVETRVEAAEHWLGSVHGAARPPSRSS